MSDLQIAIETLTSVNYGDHGARLRQSHVVVPGEPVEDLVRRVFPKLGAQYQSHDATDEVVIRVLIGANGQATGEPERATGDAF